MIFSYRTRRFLSRFFRVILVTVAVLAVALLCWLLWLQRFVVYTDEGVKLDFSLSNDIPQGIVARPPEPMETVYIQYGETVVTLPPLEAEESFVGYYVNKEELLADPAAVRAKMEALPAGTPVLLDLKNIRGYFFYSTDVGLETYKYADLAAIDELISWLGDSHLYAIARLPAFSDYVYGITNPKAGLPLASGALYFDDNRCYWLDPTHEDTQDYLIRILRELRGMGFEEVVLEEFRFPETEKVVFHKDRYLALMECAQTLVSACATESFTVSFATTDPTFPLPVTRSRLYLYNVEAVDVVDVVGQIGSAIKANRIVFVVDNTDNRYTDYGVLRPVELAG